MAFLKTQIVEAKTKGLQGPMNPVVNTTNKHQLQCETKFQKVKKKGAIE